MTKLLFDLVVVGTGTAARVVATKVRQAGWDVAVIDSRPFGGTCALRGCDPKKLLVGVAEAFDHADRMVGKGIDHGPSIIWRDAIAHKRTFTDPMPKKQEESYAQKGISTYHGTARFTGPDSIVVGGDVLKGRHFLIASGAEPVRLEIPGEEHLITNEEFLELETLPEKIIMVGGGYIAAEFSHIAARAGAKVTVLQRGERMLKRFDADLVGMLMPRFDEIGIDVRMKATVQSIEKNESGYRVVASTQDGEIEMDADLVVHAAGRVPAIRELDLGKAGISLKDRRIELNEFLQSTSNPAIYAAGDAAAVGPPLTPVSSHDAKVVAANLLEGNGHRPDYSGVPSVAFTIPPIAAVGMDEDEARESCPDVQVNQRDASDWFSALQAGEHVYGYKVLVDPRTGIILGAHLVGPNVAEVINILALAIRHRLTADDLKATMFAYPTGASGIGSML